MSIITARGRGKKCGLHNIVRLRTTAVRSLRCVKRAIALFEPFRYVRLRLLGRGNAMADHTPAGPVELGGEMDYAEHEKTYNFFLHLVKYGSLVCASLMIAMAFGFFAGGGFISSAILFVLICIVGAFLLR